MRRLAVLFVIAGVGGMGQTYQDASQSVDARVDDLVGRMTLEEKASQMLSASPAIDRLGVPAYDWWNECLHGVARAGVATVFPEPIGMAATWDTRLIFRVATAISDEARAKHEEFVRRGKRGIYEGLTFWTPNINIFRDPRWGRGMETYGEDPFLTGSLAVEFIKGLEGDDPKYLKVIATAKHFAVHSGPESTRHVANIDINARDLFDTYLPQFRMAVKEGGARSVMCAYNSVGGQPACANGPLLASILRERWGFPGYVVSDCGAISDIYGQHKAAPAAEEGVALAVKAGTDLDCGLEYLNVPAAVRKGLLTEKDVDTAVKRLFRARFDLGMFDPPEQVRWTKIPYSVNDSQAHQDLAVETARESIVLLKNENHTLPLSKGLRTVAVIGPNADDAEVLLGNYNGEPTHASTPLQGIRAKLGAAKVVYARGSAIAPGMPYFEVIPQSALQTADGKAGLTGEYFDTAAFARRAYFRSAFVSPEMRRAAAGQLARNVAGEVKPAFTHVDATVNFNWYNGAPVNEATGKTLNDDDFGVRWSGYVVAPVSGKYEIGASGLNAYEVTLEGKVIAHRDNVHERAYEWSTVELEAGKKYPIRVDFHEVHGDADIRLVWEAPHADYRAEALEAARKANAVVMVMGLSPRLEGEEMKVQVDGFAGGDRVKLGIPAVQEELLKSICAVAKGKPVVLVLLNGSAVAVNWAAEHVPAMVELWYPGQGGGAALADALFGDSNPAGRLPVTFYQSENQLPPFDDYRMTGRTYRYFTGEPLYPFGFGLSYTTFAYGRLKLPEKVAAGADLPVSVEVENTGRVAGDEVVQVYLRHVGVAGTVPIRALAGFERVRLQPGEKRTLTLRVKGSELALTREDGTRQVEAGTLEIAVGGKQPGFTGHADAGTTAVVMGKVEMTGAAVAIQ